MNITLHNPRYAEVVTAPSSKSAAHRALIAAAFADRPTRIRLTGAGADIAATLACLTALGAEISEDNGQAEWLTVTPIAAPRFAEADCGESGSTLRFLVPIVAALGCGARLGRRGRLPERPMSPLTELLAEAGVSLTDNADGSLSVTGQLPAGDYQIAAGVSSQFITGLLFALSLLDAPSTLTLTGEIESAPYIEMTLRALEAFSAKPERSADGRTYRIAGRKAAPLRSPGTLFTEGDFSGAAFPLAAGAIGSHSVRVCGLSPDTPQGDAAILPLLTQFGARVTREASGEATVSPAPLRGIDIDAKDIPDLVPVLAVVAANAEGVTRITGAARLRIKESDRIATTAALLRALGGTVQEQADGLIICGGKPLGGGTVDGAGDHRIVMSAAIASLTATAPVTITGIEAVAKSYPRFFDEVVLPDEG
ncbi:MAG: 3-phosphoshikimate 1-carboxyvinyltransferase [Clostridia bacterium]|nr:3-phosphoshikimate 1-carboxyvinyltransferase [Clostridia bacterium]